MMKRWVVGAALIACMTFAGSAFAKDHGKGSDKGRHDIRRDGIWRQDHHRDHDKRPPGWDKGKKKGWGDCDLPPGQAKKHGCYNRDRRYRYSHRRPSERREPVVGVWQRNKQTSTTTTTRSANVGTWRRPTVTQQTTTTTTTTTPTQTQGTWRK